VGSHLTQSPGSRPSSIPSDSLIHAAIWLKQIWAENWGAIPFGGGGAGSPSNTMWPGPRPTCMPSFILIRPTTWPQCTNVTDRTDRQWSGSIGCTVSQTVTPKTHLSSDSSQHTLFTSGHSHSSTNIIPPFVIICFTLSLEPAPCFTLSTSSQSPQLTALPTPVTLIAVCYSRGPQA